MIQFKKLRLRGLPFFEDQAFDLASPGVSLILGKNLNSSADNPNAVGKSFFFSQLYDLLADEQLHGTSRDLTRRGSVSLWFEVGGHSYRVTRSFSPTEKIRIWKDSKDLELRELSEAKHLLSKLIPYSPVALRSMVYLDSQLPHPLISQDSTKRREFFQEFFRLGSLKSIKKRILAKISELRDAEVELRTLKQTFESIKQNLAPDEDQLKAEVAELAGKQRTLTKDFELLNRASSLQEQLTYYEHLTSLVDGLSKSEISELESTLRSKRKKAKLALRSAEEHEAWILANQKAVQLSESLKLKLEDLDVSSTSLQTDIESAKQRLDSKESALVDQKETLRESKENLSNLKSKQRKLNSSRAELVSATGNCPTCGAKLSDTHSVKELKNVDSQLKMISAELTDTEKYLESKQLKVDSVQSAVAKLSSKLEELEDCQSLSRKISLLSSAEPTLLSKKSSLQLEDQILGLDKDLSALATYDQYESLLLSLESIPAKYRKSGSVDVSKLTEISEQLSQASIKLSESETARSQLKEFSTRAKSLKAALKDKPSLDLLEQAFSKKGVESILIKSLCIALENQVNQYSKFLFPEDFHFKFDLDTQFTITVERRYGAKTIASDVRKLSGAEKKLFSLVLMISLMTFLPKSARSSLLILDEPTAAMGPENVANFVKFLPVLQKVIPTIVVITPLDPREYSSIQHTAFTVVKDRDGVSTIK